MKTRTEENLMARAAKAARDTLIDKHLKYGVLVYGSDERDAMGKRKPRFYGRNAYKRAKRALEKQQRKELRP